MDDSSVSLNPGCREELAWPLLTLSRRRKLTLFFDETQVYFLPGRVNLRRGVDFPEPMLPSVEIVKTRRGTDMVC